MKAACGWIVVDLWSGRLDQLVGVPCDPPNCICASARLGFRGRRVVVQPVGQECRLESRENAESSQEWRRLISSFFVADHLGRTGDSKS